ncbi:MAG: hypothetical protein Q9217_001616 [Psora testacea]
MARCVRCDFLEWRLGCCEFVAKAVSFLSPLQTVSSMPSCHVTAAKLADILPGAVGAIRIRDSGLKDIYPTLRKLDRELSNRLSLPWVLLEIRPLRRVAYVLEREDIESSRRAYETARALGISIVMIEQAGHWLQDDNSPYAHLRETFIPVSIDAVALSCSLHDAE